MPVAFVVFIGTLSGMGESAIFAVAAGLLIALLVKIRKKPSNDTEAPEAEAPAVKLYRPRFNQSSRTPQSELKPNPVRHYPHCECLTPQYDDEYFDEGRQGRKRLEWQELSFHTEAQDTSSEAWKALEAYIGKIHADGAEELNPMNGIGVELWEQIVTLPPSIGKLKSVKYLSLYGSHLVRIPPEIGGMANLEEFDPYTSRCLHWLPYEITRCQKLNRSRVSTRGLYGNYKYRPPFPRLPQISPVLTPAVCSVCGGAFSQRGPEQVWISLWVATDVLPLLVHACSQACIGKLPKPANGYVESPHRGGLDLKQPPARWG